MKDQLRLLLRLQAIDVRVREIRVSMQSLPDKLQADRQTLAKLEAMIEQEKKRLAETEAWHREQERQISAEDEAVKKAKIKLQASRGSKDFSAASREVDNKRRSKSEREEEVLKVMDALEKFRKDLESHEKDVLRLRERVEAEEQRVAAASAGFQAEIVERSSGRDELVAQIEPAVLKRYEYARERRSVAVVPVIAGVCQGCHMSVPPQLSNVLARMNSIEVCPRCQRVLYRQELLEDADGTPA